LLQPKQLKRRKNLRRRKRRRKLLNLNQKKRVD
jgi:hypothetical protein